jgi:hypothetical protein
MYGIHPFFALPSVFFYAFESRPAIQSNGQLPPLAQHLMRVAILMIKRIHAGSFLCVLKIQAPDRRLHGPDAYCDHFMDIGVSGRLNFSGGTSKHLSLTTIH